MPNALYPFGHEIAKVQSELVMFRDECLPVFLGPHPHETPHSIRASEIEESNQFLPWYEAVTKLSEALPLPGDSLAPLHAEEFKDFMFQEATPAYSLSNNGIRWKIGLFCDMRIALWDNYRPPCLGKEITEEDSCAAIPVIEEWFLSFDAMDGRLWNPLCMTLPFVADADPAFARKALDLKTWNNERLPFRCVINNALLHVLGSLANNHFMLIRDYLDHPCLYGNYTHLMPHYLFAVLFQKVGILRRLLQSKPSAEPPKAN